LIAAMLSKYVDTVPFFAQKRVFLVMGRALISFAFVLVVLAESPNC